MSTFDEAIANLRRDHGHDQKLMGSVDRFLEADAELARLLKLPDAELAVEARAWAAAREAKAAA